MKAPWTDPSFRELLTLPALAALGCGGAKRVRAEVIGRAGETHPEVVKCKKV